MAYVVIWAVVIGAIFLLNLSAEEYEDLIPKPIKIIIAIIIICIMFPFIPAIVAMLWAATQ